jgi:hypothetical protein
MKSRSTSMSASTLWVTWSVKGDSPAHALDDQR